jgi:hypothetical protein
MKYPLAYIELNLNQKQYIENMEKIRDRSRRRSNAEKVMHYLNSDIPSPATVPAIAAFSYPSSAQRLVQPEKKNNRISILCFSV